MRSAATNNQTGEGVAIKKVTNVFSKKILAKRALREIKLLQHFRGESIAPAPTSSTDTDGHQDIATYDIPTSIASPTSPPRPSRELTRRATDNMPL